MLGRSSSPSAGSRPSGRSDRSRPIQLSAPKDPAPTELAIADGVFPAVARIDATKASGTVSSTAVVFRDDGHLLTTADAVEGADSADGAALRRHDAAGRRRRRRPVHRRRRGQDRPRAARRPRCSAWTPTLQLGEPTIAIECTPGKAGSPNVSVGLISALDRRVDDDDGIVDARHDPDQRPGVDRRLRRGADRQLRRRHRPRHPPGPRRRRRRSGRHRDHQPGQHQGRRAGAPLRHPDRVRQGRGRRADHPSATSSTPWLGVETRDLSDSETDRLGRTGARVDSVTPGSPAANAGLQAGDIVLGIDNHPIGSSSDLVVALRRYKPNESVGITYERDGGDQVALAILAEKLAVP